MKHVAYAPLNKGEVIGVPQRLVFKDGLCDCVSDVPVCCLGTFCTPCLYGQNYQKLMLLSGVPEEDAGCGNPCCHYYCSSALPTLACSGMFGSALSFPAIAAHLPVLMPLFKTCIKMAAATGVGMVAGTNRKIIRAKFGVQQGANSEDFCTHFWCSPCAVCQEAREINSHFVPQMDSMVAPGAEIMK